ncbi:MAG: hypothetical protein JWL86_2144 [Rhizobium sp.]|nr:hypothetical protein [Rhizobium sp.]
MADNTSIEWTDATVNAVNGCSVISPGCTNCYAMRAGGRNLPRHPSTGLTVPTKAGHVWSGEVRLDEARLLLPLRWKRPRRIFWNAHGDLFHPKVPDEWIDRVFAVCALTPQHTHQILTKRSARMREYLSDPKLPKRLALVLFDMNRTGLAKFSAMFAALGDRARDDDAEFVPMPLPNVHFGVSVEDQARADERIPDLIATPAAVRFLSCEPLLGLIDPRLGAGFCRACGQMTKGTIDGNCMDPASACFAGEAGVDSLINWVIVGGESGNGARPMHPDWARSLRDQCEAAGVPFHFKQWGAWAPLCALDESYAADFYAPIPAGRDPEAVRRCRVEQMVMQSSGRVFPLDQWSRMSGENPAAGDFAYQQGAGGMHFFHCGKKRAGRLLDGVEHNGVPA